MEQTDTMPVRAARRGAPVPGTELMTDDGVAPIMDRILFRHGRLEAACTRELVAHALGRL
ncbi:hypothetical protein AB0H45_19895 [Streptomyces atroolivaceus]|uniref:Uncharacterized protein n=1 Tax=Streptomyces atroolivaceus TaxID=66869 RepID=A0ABV9VAL7_STRAZ|nr:hypothetical protein [Streptomyces atroolivaceus]